MSSLLSLYHSLPAAVRPVVAGARGYYLRRWRYGVETDELVRQALERERWTAAQWQDWQDERLDELLLRAAARVPYYRQLLHGRRTPRQLADWPVLEKETLRADARAFVADDCDIKEMFHDHTSGTTGKALDLWQTRPTVRAWYALFEARCRQWYGVSRHDRWGMLGGQLVVPVARRQPPFWVWNAGLNQLYLSSYHLAPDLVPHYLDALEKYRVKYLLGYTSALHALASCVLESGRKPPALKVIITNAEPVFDYQRLAITTAFRCPVRETYGMAEMVAAAGECEAGKLHLWPEAGVVEVNDGELICTGLMNRDMPLIRYRVGDRATLADDGESCSCGRTLPVLASIEGRLDDVLYTMDGRMVGRLDPVFKAHLPVREAQIVQERLDEITVRYVPAPGYTAAAGKSIVARLQDRLGPVKVTLEELPEIPRTPTGKFRAVICNLSAKERRRIATPVGS
jgi:phenylacetate-CoA ligase